MEEPKEKETSEEKEVIEEAETAEAKTPTPEEQLSTLQSQLTETKQELEETKTGLKTTHAKVTEKDRELKQRASLESQIQRQEESIQFLASMVAKASGRTEQDLDESAGKVDSVGDFNKWQKDRDEKRKQDDFNTKVNEFEVKVTDIGLTRKDDEYWEVFDMVSRGQFDRADIRLEKIAEARSEKKAPESSEPNETEEEKIERKAEERSEVKLREKMEKKGLLISDIGAPSASSSKKEETLKKFIEGEASLKDAEEALK